MKKRKLLTIKVVPGMTVADDVYTEDNQLIVSSNTVLTTRVIARLKFYSIYEISIYDTEQNNNVKIFSNQDEKKGYLDKVRDTNEFKQFSKVFLSTVDSVKKSLSVIVKKNEPVRVEELVQEMENLIKESRNGLHLLDMIHCIRHYDDSTYVHSVNVSLLCHVMGEWLGFSKEDIEVLTISGLLHDIGKLMIPKEILKKPSSLRPDEYAIIQSHTVHGYNILNEKDIDKRIAYAALMHHERCDGSGYPSGDRGPTIEMFAKVVAIADVYDAMTSNRVYREAICPFDVIGIFEEDGITKYEPSFLLPFLESVVQSYMNNTVRLSNKKMGKVIMINKLSLSRPVISMGHSFVDLSKEKNLSIVQIL